MHLKSKFKQPDRTASHRDTCSQNYTVYLVKLLSINTKINGAPPDSIIAAFSGEPILRQKINIHIIINSWYAFSLYIHVGVVCEPFLGGPTTPVCKSDNENLTFTCKDSQVQFLQWKMEPDFLNNNNIILFTVNSKNGTEQAHVNYTAILTNNTNGNTTLGVANLISTLTVPASSISNETVIICETSSAGIIRQSSIKLTTAGTVIQLHTAYSNQI